MASSATARKREEQFLDDREVIIFWKELCAAIEPFWPDPQGAGRRPIGIDRMLRVHFPQHWFNLSDPPAGEALYDSRTMRRLSASISAKNRVPAKPPSANSAA